MNNTKIISPCISICKNDPKTGLCFGCARSTEEKKTWKLPETTNEEKDYKKWEAKQITFEKMLAKSQNNDNLQLVKKDK